MLLVPFETAFFAVDSNPQGALVARGDLARPQLTPGAALETQQHVGVVVERPAGHEGGQFGAELGDLEAGDEGGQMVGVGADVADAARRPGLLGVGAPGRLLVTRILDFLAQPVLGVLDLDHPDGAELARQHHLARLPDHGIAGVVVGQAEHQAGPPHRLGQVHGIVERGGQRLVADDVDSGLQERRGGPVVEVVRRHDGDDVDTVAARRLRRRHLGVATVGPFARHAEFGGRSPAAVGVTGESAGDQLVAVVEARRDPVHPADEGALAAADHAEPQAPAQRLAVGGRVGRHDPVSPFSGFGADPERAQDCRPRRCHRRSRRRPSRWRGLGGAGGAVAHEPGTLARAVLGMLQAAVPRQNPICHGNHSIPGHRRLPSSAGTRPS